MSFRFKYDKPVLYDLADATVTGTWDCATGSGVGAACITNGVAAGLACATGTSAGEACNTFGYNPFWSWCINGTRNAVLCGSGSST